MRRLSMRAVDGRWCPLRPTLHLAAILALLLAAAPDPFTARAQPATPSPAPTSPSRGTPGPLLNVPILGDVPRCAITADLRPPDTSVRANEPLTITLRVRATCPNLMDDRSAVVLVGGLPSPAGIDDARAALHGIVDTFASGARNRLAFIDVATPESPVAWAATDPAFAAIGDRVDRIVARPWLAPTAWFSALERAESMLSAVDARSRPFLVVVDGTGASAGQDIVRSRIGRLGTTARDGAGHALLVDLSLDGRIFRPLVEGDGLDGPFLFVFGHAAPRQVVDENVRAMMNAFHAPIESITALVQADVVQGLHTCAPVDSFPSALNLGDGTLSRTFAVGARSAELRFQAVYRIQQPRFAGSAVSLVLLQRTNAPGVDPPTTAQTTFCLDDGDVGPSGCSPEDFFEPIPLSCRLSARIVLPLVSGGVD